MRQRFKTDHEDRKIKRISDREKIPCARKKHDSKEINKDDCIELMEEIKKKPKFSEKEGSEDYYGKAFSYFQYWLPENREHNLDQDACNEFFNSLRHQRDFFIRSLNFEAGFREKAKIIDKLIEEESEKFAREAGLSPLVEKGIRRELKGTKSLKTTTKWFERVPKKEPHSESEVRKFLKPWMKDGLPTVNDLYRSSKARFYKKVYLGVLESCCNYFRGRYMEEDRKFRKKMHELINSKRPLSRGTFERTVHSRWLLNLNISHAICTYSREMQMSFIDFNMMPNNMFRTAMKSCLSEYRNFVLNKYTRIPNHSNTFKLREKKLSLEKKIIDFDCHRLNPPFYPTSTGSRIPVRKENPFLSYDEHVENAARRGMTISQHVFRKFRESKVRLVTQCQLGKINRVSRWQVCVANKKRFCIRGKSFGPVFEVLHDKFSKVEKRRETPKNKRRYSRARELRKSEPDTSSGASDVRKSGTFGPNTENKIDRLGRTKLAKSFESVRPIGSPTTENLMDGCNRRNGGDDNYPRIFSTGNYGMKAPWKDIYDYKVRNREISKAESCTVSNVDSEMLPKDMFFYQSELGTRYALHRYENEMNTLSEIYNAINKTRSYTVGYASELFYWIRAYFEEYRRIKKRQPPLNYLFRKTYLPDPYLHFCPINKMPNLDWLLLKLQNNERISEALTYGYSTPMKEETLKKCKSCFNRKAHYLQGLELFKCLRLFKPIREIPCSCCFPDYKGDRIYECGLSKECPWKAETDKELHPNSFEKSNFENICCGMMKSSSGIKPQNPTNIFPTTEDYKKIFNAIFNNMSDFIVLGNIHRSKEHLFKEKVLTPVISAGKEFFKRYFGEYLCLFTREQSALGTLCNYRVVRRSKEHESWSGFEDLMVDTLIEVDAELIKARSYVPFNVPVRMVEADTFSVYGYKGARQKYYNDKSELTLTHEYTFLKYKNIKPSDSVDTKSDIDDTLTELLVNIETLLTEGFPERNTGEDPFKERVIERLITQDADDSEWTIYENLKAEESLKVPHLSQSQLSLVEYESDPYLEPTSNTEKNENSNLAGQKTVSSANDEPTSDPNLTDDNEPHNPDVKVVSFATVHQTFGDNPSPPIRPTSQSTTIMSSDTNVDSSLRPSAASKEDELANQRLASEGDRYRQTFFFQKYDQDSFSLTRKDTGVTKRHSPYVPLLVDSDDGKEDSVPLTYEQVLRQKVSKSDLLGGNGTSKGITKYESTFSIPATPEPSSISAKQSVYSFDLDNDPDLTYDTQEDTLKDIWFYDRSGKLQKHKNRRRRAIDVNGKKRSPAECALISQWYYNKFASNQSKKMLMHLVLTCWNAHQRKSFTKSERGRDKTSNSQAKKRSRVQKAKESERVFWRNRKIIIDDDFRDKTFVPTKKDTYHNEFFKNSYNAVQYWIHKTLVTPSSAKSGWFKEVQKKEEAALKRLEEEAKKDDENCSPADIDDAINKIREHNLKRYGTELNSYSNVWNTFWEDWKEGRYKDVYDPNLLCDRNNVDSDDESINLDDFVLGFPTYSNSENSLPKDFEARFTNFLANKKFSEDLENELSHILGSFDLTHTED